MLDQISLPSLASPVEIGLRQNWSYIRIQYRGTIQAYQPTNQEEEHHEKHPKPDAKSLLYVLGGYLDDRVDQPSPDLNGLKYMPSPKLLMLWPSSLTILRKFVDAVFHNGSSDPSFDGDGQSYFNFIGIEYDCESIRNEV